MKDLRLVVISGPSGSGKSTVIKVLEDVGFYCVDNLPVTLLPEFLELLAKSPEIDKVAAVVDVREGEFLKEFSSIFRECKQRGYRVELLYLECTDEVLLRRFSETRRRHPLAFAGSPAEGIRAERELLREIKSEAERVMDTTELNVHELKSRIKKYFSSRLGAGRMALNLVSFGYRHGVPIESDIVMDVRFLPNPYFVEELSGLDGTDDLVKDYVLSKDDSIHFMERFKDFLDYLIPLYLKEGKSYLTIAIGCTGGRHRSVVLVDKLAEEISSDVLITSVRHRDKDEG